MRTSPTRPVTTIQRHAPARRAIAGSIGAVAGVAAFCGVQVVAGGAATAEAELPAAAHTNVVERSTCRTLDDGNDDASAPGPAARGDEGTAPVVVGVRPTAMLRLDTSGQVVAAWTNTGCAPRPNDDTYIAYPSGSIVQASGSMVDARWTGDFTESGVFVAQR